MNIVNAFQKKPQDHLTFFVTVYIMLQSTSLKSIAYRCIIRPVLEYACPLWHPHTAKNINVLESVQRRAARWASNSRWITSSYWWSKSPDDCLIELNWLSIQKRHNYYSICYVHDSLHHRDSLPFSKHFLLSQVSTRSHILTIQPVTSSINSFRYSWTALFCGTPCLIPSCRLKSHLYSVQPSVIFFFDMYFLWILRFIVCVCCSVLSM